MKNLDEYVRSDATKFRDYLFAKGLNGASVARIFGTVRAVINLALSEFGLSIVNPFSNVYFDQSQGVKKRMPVKPEDIEKVHRRKAVGNRRARSPRRGPAGALNNHTPQ